MAILPFHCRAGDKHKDLATAIALVAGGEIQRSGRAVVVDRERIERVLREKHLARAALTDKAELARRGRMIGADLIVAGHYNILDGKLLIRADLIPAEKSDFYAMFRDAERNFKRVEAAGELAQAVAVLQEFAVRLRDSLPAPPRPTSRKAAARPDTADRALAVFDLTAVPATAQVKSLALALTELLSGDMREALAARIVERERLEAILRERKLRLSGLVHRSDAVRAARLVGADCLLLGSVVHYGDVARLDVQVLDVATGAVLATASQTGPYGQLMKVRRRLSVDVARNLGAGLERLRRLVLRQACLG